jgi:hypothetical protein
VHDRMPSEHEDEHVVSMRETAGTVGVVRFSNIQVKERVGQSIFLSGRAASIDAISTDVSAHPTALSRVRVALPGSDMAPYPGTVPLSEKICRLSSSLGRSLSGR